MVDAKGFVQELLLCRCERLGTLWLWCVAADTAWLGFSRWRCIMRCARTKCVSGVQLESTRRESSLGCRGKKRGSNRKCHTVVGSPQTMNYYSKETKCNRSSVLYKSVKSANAEVCCSRSMAFRERDEVRHGDLQPIIADRAPRPIAIRGAPAFKVAPT